MMTTNNNDALSRRSMCGSALYGATLVLAGCGGGGGGDAAPAANSGGTAAPAAINGGLTGKMYYSFTSTVGIVDLASGNFTEISRKISASGELPFLYNSTYIELSPDSKTLYFAETRVADKLTALDIASNTAKSVFALSSASEWGEIRLSPDGQKVAMVRNGTSSKNGVYVFDTSGKTITFYAVNPDAANSIAWTSDNRLLYSNGGIYLTNPGDLKNALRINTTSASSVSISPAGNKIVYAAQGHIWTMGIAGDNVQQVTAGDNAEFQPRWSPDGKYIVFQNRIEGTVGGSVTSVNFLYYLGVIPADGKQYTIKKGGTSGSTVCGLGCSAVTTTGITPGEGVILLKVRSAGFLSDIAVYDMIWR